MQKGVETERKYITEYKLNFSGHANNFSNLIPSNVGMSSKSKQKTGIPSGSILSGNN
jgi:hypothetical protein